GCYGSCGDWKVGGRNQHSHSINTGWGGKMTVLELSLAESVAEFSPELWGELEGPEAYPFLRREWLRAFEDSDCLGPDRGWVPRHLVVNQGSEILAIAPAYIKLHSMGSSCSTKVGRNSLKADSGELTSP